MSTLWSVKFLQAPDKDLITGVSLYDKVIKTEDCIVSAQPYLEDFLPGNRRWVKKTVLPGRLEASREKMCRPMFGHLAKQALPQRFYVQLGRQDKHMTVIPLEFMRSLNTQLPRSVPLATCQPIKIYTSIDNINASFLD
jgi:hypothetical protein